MEKWKRKKTELVLDEKFFKVRKDRVILPNGHEKDWIYLDKSNSPSAMVIGITKDKKVIMNCQYRYLVGKKVMDLPAGYKEKGEKIEQTARREFEEEAGYKCKKLKKICSVWETYGPLKHQIHIFFASGLKKTKQHLEEPENIKTLHVDFDKAVGLAAKNKIPDVVSAHAILLLKEKIARGEIKI